MRDGGEPSHWARAAGADGRSTEVALRTGTSGTSGQAGHLRSGNQGKRGRWAPAWSRVRGSTRERGRRGGPKASVDPEASTVGRMEAKEVAGEQGCQGRSRGRAGSHQVSNSPEDQGRGGVSGT